MSAVLTSHDLVKIYGGRRVLDGIDLVAAPGHRLGLIGENGAGKSTLLRLLAGVEQPDGGQVTRPDEVGFLRQEMAYPPGATVRQVVDDALAPIHAARRRLDTLADQLTRHPYDAAALASYGEVLQWATDHDVWGADRRAELVLAGLGLAATDRQRPVASLSGGERSRLALAGLLIGQPRALLLDEPTNHLDDEAIEFVQEHLTRLPGAVVVASHDRVFLDAVCTGLLDLDPSQGQPTYYGGGYRDYLREKRLRRRSWEQQYAAEQRELAELRRAVATTSRQVAHNRPRRDGDKTAYERHGGRVEAQVSRRVRNAQRRLAELTRRQVRKPPAPLRLRPQLTSSGQAGSILLSVRRAWLPGRLYVDRLDLPAAGRLLVEGPNGAGKSTLLGLLAGRLPPVSGTVTPQRGLRIGLLAQEVTFPDPAATARRLYEATVPPDAVALTELGLLAPRDLDRPVAELSVGQRRRLGLALLVADAPQLLLLDEPTNHISLTLAEQLEQALDTTPGAVVVASHDRWLRRRWRGPRLMINPDHRVSW